MDEKDEKTSKRSRARNADFSSVTKRRTRDFEQLILLHKRFEEDALRFFRRGYVSPSRTSPYQPEETSFARDLSRKMMLDYFPSLSYLNDDDYFKELLGNFRGKLDENHGFASERLTLKLPKMESISSTNKAIFYTSLPKIPSLPARNENRKKGMCSFSGNVPKHRGNASGKDQSFFRIKPATLTWKGDLNEDVNAIKTVRESNCKMESQIQVVLPKIGAEKVRRKAEKRNFPNQDCSSSLENDLKMKNNSRTDKCLDEKGNLQKGDEKTVHFRELLHEVHVYSPSMPGR